MPDDALGAWLDQRFDPDDKSDVANALRNEKDSEPDLFTFQAGGHTGKFFIDKYDKRQVKQVPQSDCKITITWNDDAPGVLSSFAGFEIVTPEGTTYRFGGIVDLGAGKVQLSDMRYGVPGTTWNNSETVADKRLDDAFPASFYLREIEDHIGNKIRYKYAPRHYNTRGYTSAFASYRTRESKLCMDPREPDCRPDDELQPANMFSLELLEIRGTDEIVTLEWEDYESSLNQRLLRKISKNEGEFGANVLFEYDSFVSDERNSELIYAPANPMQTRKPALTRIVPCGKEPIKGRYDQYPPHYSFTYNSLTGHPYAYIGYKDEGNGGIGRVRYDYTDYMGFAADANTWFGLPEVFVGAKMYGRGDRDPVHEISERTLLKAVRLPAGGEIALEYEPHDYVTYLSRFASQTFSCYPDACGPSNWEPFEATESTLSDASLKIYSNSESVAGVIQLAVRKAGSTTGPPPASFNTSASESDAPPTDLGRWLRNYFGESFTYGNYEFQVSGFPVNGGSPGKGGAATFSGTVRMTFTSFSGNEKAPGSRVAAITTSDGLSDPLRVSYDYTQPNSGTGESSGVVMAIPNYVDRGESFARVSNVSPMNLRFYSGSQIQYKEIATVTPGRGRVARSFAFDGEVYGQVDSRTNASRPTIYNRFDGTLTREAHFAEGADTPYSETEYDYDDGYASSFYDTEGYTVTTGYFGDPIVRKQQIARSIPPRVARVESVVDGRATSTEIEYAEGLFGPYTSVATSELPDGTTKRILYQYTNDYDEGGSGEITEALVERNIVGIPYKTSTYKSGELLGVELTEFSNFNLSTGNPVESAGSQGTAVLPIRSLLSSSETSADDYSSVTGRAATRVMYEVERIDSKGRPIRTRSFGANLPTDRVFKSDLLEEVRYGTSVMRYKYTNRLLSSSVQPDGIGESSSYDEHNRLEESEGCDGSSASYVYYTTQAAGRQALSVIEKTSKASDQGTPQISYVKMDGLGRTVQTVAAGSSASTPTAGANGEGIIVTRTDYNKYGQVEREYAAVTQQASIARAQQELLGGNGKGRFTDYTYEASPRSRIKSAKLVNGYITTYDYDYNTGSEASYGYPSSFSANQLSRTRVIDHGGHVRETLSDSWGNRIVSREFAQGASTSREVRYGYDVKNQLRRVTPYAGAVGKPGYQYAYEYDAFGQETYAKIPGGSPTRAVYDPATGRLAARQDGRVREAGKHWAYRYDDYGNLVQSGWNPGDPSVSASITELLNDDTYDYAAGSISFGQMTMHRSRMLDAADEWIVEQTEYDRAAAPCGQAVGSLANGTIKLSAPSLYREAVTYDANQNVEQRQVTYSIPWSFVQETYTPTYTADLVEGGMDYLLRYDRTRLATSLVAYDAPLYETEYTAYGEQAYQRVSKTGGTWLQQVDYAYDAIGRLTAINEPLGGRRTGSWSRGPTGPRLRSPPRANLPARSAAQAERDIFYEGVSYTGHTPGSPYTAGHESLVQETRVQTKGRRAVVNSYAYDGYLRLSGYLATELDAGGGALAADRFARSATSGYRYDDYDRPLGIEREDASGVTYDDLSYGYAAAGPMVERIRDAAAGIGGHEDSGDGEAYAYNAHGDVTADPYRGLRYAYNELGFAMEIASTLAGEGGRAEYRYSADGVLRASRELDQLDRPRRSLSYVGGARFNSFDNGLYLPNPVGAFSLKAREPAYGVFHQTDHLGNLVAAYRDADGDGVINTADAAELIEENRFAPYGRRDGNYERQSSKVPFGYNGAEELALKGAEDLHLTTFRTMTQETALWGQTDPKAEAMYGSSPYTSMGGNPISYADPHGDLFMLPVLAMVAWTGGVLGAAASGGPTGDLGDAARGFAFGALSSAAGAGVASGVSASIAGGSFGAGFLGTTGVASIGFNAGALGGAAGGFTGGFLNGTGSALAQNQSFGSALQAGLRAGLWGGLSGGLAGGIRGGIQSSKMNLNFFTGRGEVSIASAGANGVQTVSNMPIKYVGQYETWTPVFESPDMGGAGVTLPGFGIVVGDGAYSQGFSPSLMKHEFGHILQARAIGLRSFYSKVGTYSLASASIDPRAC